MGSVGCCSTNRCIEEAAALTRLSARLRSYTLTLSYSLASKHPFSVYGETVFMAIQST